MSDDTIIRITAPAATPSASKRKPPALGRGLGALLGDMRENVAGSPSASAVTGFATLSIADIEPHPDQPRRHFDEAALDELAASIAQRGVIQPIVVRRLAASGQPGERYQLVAGERRWRAAQRAHLHEIPALVRDLSDRDVMALALIENLQRQDLNPIEEARAYQRLGNEEGLTQADIARMVDKSRSHVANLQRLLTLPDTVIAMVEAGTLSMGHARALIGVDDAPQIAEATVTRGLSVREVETLVRHSSKAEDAAPSRRARARQPASDDADLIAVQTQLEELLGLSVRIATDAGANTGTVTIGYRTLDQLDLVCQRLSGGAI